MNTNTGIMIMIDSGFDSGSSPELLQHQHEEPPMSRTAQYRKVRIFWYYYYKPYKFFDTNRTVARRFKITFLQSFLSN